MSNVASEKLDIVIDLTKLRDVEVRDERGVTKLVIPIEDNKIKLTCAGSAFIRLLALPVKSAVPLHTHGVKTYAPVGLRRKSDHTDFIGNIFRHGKIEYDDEREAETMARRIEANKAKQRRNKYKGLEF